MKSARYQFPTARVLLFTLGIATLILASVIPLPAQQDNSNSVDAQRQAMQKLSFLVGRWKGPVTVERGPGEPLRLTQTENVQYKLDGLVMLIEGQSTGADGRVAFSALATISYDDASHTYRFRAYNDGHYLDTELTVPGQGFSWGFMAGPAHIVNTMQLTGKGEWNEVTDMTMGGNPPQRSMEMTLQLEP